MEMDPNQLKAISEFLPKSTKEALLNPAADAVGRGFGGLLYFIFQKPIKLGIIKQAEFEKLTKELADKLKEVPVSRRTDEKKGLLIKTMEDSKYSLGDDALRGHFVNLLVNTVDKNLVDSVTPYFSTILSNMSHSDAEFLAMFQGWEYGTPVNLPLVNVKMIQTNNFKGPKSIPGRNSFAYWKKDVVIHQTASNAFKFEEPSKSIDLFESFGVVSRNLNSYSSYLNDSFEHYIDSPEMKHLKYSQKIKSPTEQLYDSIEFEKGQIELTDLGRLFVSCVFDHFVIKI